MYAKMLVNLEDWQIKEINHIAENDHISKSEVIRRAISSFLHKNTNDAKLEGTKPHPLLKYAGILKDKNIDGLEYQHSIRDEWEK